jgi:carboxyl-terminal processing protease
MPSPKRPRARFQLFCLAMCAGLAPASAQATPQNRSPYLPFDQMARVMVMVEHNYVEPAQRERLLDGAMRGMVAELDPHSSYMNPKEFEEFQSDTEGKFAGIGIEVEMRDDYVTVLAPIAGSPAARAGLQSGDKILAVDRKPLRGLKLDRIIDLMRGEAGTKIALTVGREGTTDPLHFDLVREVVRVASIEAKRLDNGVLYIRLKQFQETSHEELLRAVAKARKEDKAPIEGVLLDMRFNPGGLVDQAELIADEFMNQGVIYSTRHRGQVLDLVEATQGGALSREKLVILVNEYSASAAELVAGALQDTNRGKVVGALTFGKGSVQTIFELPGASGLRLTTMRYYTPNGRAIQAQGIDPDVVIKPAKPVDVVREGDLQGALEAETERPARNGQVSYDSPADSKPTVVIADIPSDPRQGKDFALGKAFDVLVASAKPR